MVGSFPALILGLAIATTSLVLAQQESSPDQPQDEPDKSAQSVPFSELPWPIKLGVRSAMLKEKVAIADRVVLVPDLATWLDEIARWRPLLRWPVLIEDDLYTPLFVRAYKPKQLIRRSPVKAALPKTAAQLEDLARATMLATWGGDPVSPESKTIDGVYRRHGWVPQGIVATSFGDPAWPAALALAIGRGQLLRTLDGDFGSPNQSADKLAIDRIERAVERMFADSGWSWESLGDDLDALTLCRELPVRVETPLPNSMQVKISGAGAQKRGSSAPVALTDLLCRNVDGARFAICGWIWGDQVRSVYMAMCSLFLDRDSVLLVNSYSEENEWRAYSMTEAADSLMTAGYTVPGVHTGDSSTISAWQRLVMGGPQTDVLIFNSSGGESDMNLAQSTRGSTHDIPALSRPLALHMIHSYSLHSPSDSGTIGGRWLEQGVYAYVGSCDEPYLQAFIPPKALVERIVNFVPFLVAGRTVFGEMNKPWRVATIGDPLMLIEPPPRRARKRLDLNIPLVSGDTDVRKSVVKRLRQKDQPVEARTLKDLQLLSQDELARTLWKRILDNSPTSEQAEAMLPLFFQQRDSASYLLAYRAAGDPAGHARDMLWTLYLPRVKASRSVSDLVTLQRSLRSGLAAEDLELLLPTIEKMQGRSQRRVAIARALELADNEDDRKGLRVLLDAEAR